jgi:hypothetical protein
MTKPGNSAMLTITTNVASKIASVLANVLPSARLTHTHHITASMARPECDQNGQTTDICRAHHDNAAPTCTMSTTMSQMSTETPM